MSSSLSSVSKILLKNETILLSLSLALPISLKERAFVSIFFVWESDFSSDAILLISSLSVNSAFFTSWVSFFIFLLLIFFSLETNSLFVSLLTFSFSMFAVALLSEKSFSLIRLTD